MVYYDEANKGVNWTQAGHTPLHQAAQQGHVLVTQLLLRHKANPNSITSVSVVWKFISFLDERCRCFRHFIRMAKLRSGLQKDLDICQWLRCSKESHLHNLRIRSATGTNLSNLKPCTMFLCQMKKRRTKVDIKIY